MKVEVNDCKTLYALRAGDTFMFEHEYFIVTDEINDAGKGCLNLRTGIIVIHSCDLLVMPTNLKVVRDEST